MTADSDNDQFAAERRRMIETQLKARNICNVRLLDVMGKLARHAFVDPDDIDRAYDDGPLPIACNQTISQPYIVASMTENLVVTPQSRILEIGTGCGYQTAVLAELAFEVFTVERIELLFASARERLAGMGYTNVHLRHGNGADGWSEHSPYDGIIITAATTEIPPALLEQVTVGGRIVAPLIEGHRQYLFCVTRRDTGYEYNRLYPVRFVPLIDSNRN